jgi:hypothetical protein
MSALRITGCGSLLEPTLVAVRRSDRARDDGVERPANSWSPIRTGCVWHPAATAKEFEPGDLRVCTARRRPVRTLDLR